MSRPPRKDSDMVASISASLEDYLESILMIQTRSGRVRVKDLAESIEVKAPSVIEALAALRKKGLVIHERYGAVELTSAGLQLAQKIYRRHETLKKFFHEVLGVQESLAEIDACRIEHYLSREATDRILAFIRFVETSSGKTASHWNHFPRWVRRQKSLKSKTRTGLPRRGVRKAKKKAAKP